MTVLEEPVEIDNLLTAEYEEGIRPVLIDVRLAEDFAAGHIPGAAGNCVYEVAFNDRLAEVAPNRDAPVIVYGANENSAESAMAAEKLIRSGYRKIYDFRPGFAAWESAERQIDRDAGPAHTPKLEDGRYDLDLEESRVTWTGRNLINSHTGTVAIQHGWLQIDKGLITSGEIQLDMNRMTCTDLEGNPAHDVLIHHLQSDDFFDTGHFPDARFVIVDTRRIDAPGAQNLKVKGGATIKGQTHPLQFTVAAGVTDEGMPAAQASLVLDRTKWGVIYGSGKYFHRLAGHLVNDEIEIQMRLLTKKA